MAENESSIIVRLKDEVSEWLRKIGSGFGELFDAIGGGTIAAGAAIAELTKKIIDWTKEAGDAQTVQLETVRVTEQVGTQAGYTASQIENLTKEISRKTGAEDIDLQAVANMVLVHENLSGKTFPAVLQAITDMSFVMGKGTIDSNSLSEAEHLLAGAMESPERAARMLKNSIVPLSDSAKEAIKDAMAHGDAEKARAIILDDVQKHIKGAAENLGTYARSNNDLNTAFKGFAETVGAIFLPTWITIKETLATVVNSISGVIKIFETLSRASMDMTKLNFSHMTQYKTDIANAAFDVSNTWKNLTKNIKAELDSQSKTETEHAKKNHKAKTDDQKKLDADIIAIQKKYHDDAAAAKKDYDTKIVQLESARGSDISRLKHDLELDLKTQDQAAKADQMVADGKFDELRLKATMDGAQQRIDIAKNEAEEKKRLEQDVHTLVGELSSLQQSKNKNLWEIGKQAAAANVLIKGAEAIMGFWASAAELGPIAGPIFAGIETAAVVAIGAEQINQIESQSFPAAAGGAFAKGDGVNARFGEPGNPEAILNEPQLRSIISRAVSQSGGGGNGVTNLILDKSTIAKWSVANSQQQYRLQKEGRLS